MPTPPAAYARWNSTRSVVTRGRWLSPSYVAALMTRLRRVSGPILPAEKTSGTPVSRTRSISLGYPGPTADCSLVPERADRPRRPDHVVQDPRQLTGAALPRRELAVGPVGEVLQRHLRSHGVHHHGGQDAAPLLDRSSGAVEAVAHEARHLVVPLGVEQVDRVLHRRRYAVVVLRRHPDEPVEPVDEAAPGPGGLALVVALRGARVHRFVEQRQVVVVELHELELRVVPLDRRVEHPPPHG